MEGPWRCFSIRLRLAASSTGCCPRLICLSVRLCVLLPSLSAASPTYPPIPWSSHFLLVQAMRRSMRVDSEAVVCWPITPRADTGLYVGDDDDTWQHGEGRAWSKEEGEAAAAESQQFDNEVGGERVRQAGR